MILGRWEIGCMFKSCTINGTVLAYKYVSLLCSRSKGKQWFIALSKAQTFFNFLRWVYLLNCMLCCFTACKKIIKIYFINWLEWHTNISTLTNTLWQKNIVHLDWHFIANNFDHQSNINFQLSYLCVSLKQF